MRGAARRAHIASHRARRSFSYWESLTLLPL